MSRLRISPELCLFALLVVPVYGQIDRGTIKGTVTDPQNATVPGAKITLSNPATGRKRRHYDRGRRILQLCRPCGRTVQADV